ncbi:MAG: polyprenyl synthetase family protein [Candidatus Lokiarchaeota archaeon]|nr:polyprenyl synthetase family protein [Candidatus Lokiarchaeota archaeon]
MIEEYLKTEKFFVDGELEKYFIRISKIEKDILLKDFITQLEEFILNEKAKRIHPVLMNAAFSGIVNPMYLEDQIEQIREVSIAVELLHSGHLIHDDLLDDDLIRRDKPTFHVQLKNELNQTYKDTNAPIKEELVNLYGRDMSILGGMQGYLLGLDILKSAKFPEQTKLLAINEYTQAMDFLMKGQLIEEYMNYNNIIMTLEQYLNIAEYQRARLFEKSAKIGAILAKGNIHYQIKPLSDALLSIGQAHAIRDDIIDLTDDIKAKNRSKIIYILAVNNTDEEQSKILNEVYRKETLTNNDVKSVKDIFTQTNALMIAEHLAKNLVEQAKNNLKDIYPDLNREQKIFFNEFSDFVYEREF